jgi:hypothetical protein
VPAGRGGERGSAKADRRTAALGQDRRRAVRHPRAGRSPPYLPGRNRVLEQMSRPIREAANGLVLKDYRASRPV